VAYKPYRYLALKISPNFRRKVRIVFIVFFGSSIDRYIYLSYPIKSKKASRMQGNRIHRQFPKNLDNVFKKVSRDIYG